MFRFFSLRRMLAVLGLLLLPTLQPHAAAQSPVRCKCEGELSLGADGSAAFLLTGQATHLGKFSVYGRVVFTAGLNPGELRGAGVAVFKAANGDLLVGVIAWEIAADGTGTAAFAWRDSIALPDGTEVASTGRFATERPPGGKVLSSTGDLSKPGTTQLVWTLGMGDC